MKRSFYRILSILLAVCLMTALLPLSASAEEGVCYIGTTQYNSLGEALSAAQDGDTITLLDHISHNTGILIGDGRHITFDLNGFCLTVTNNAGIGLEVTNGHVDLSDSPGAFHVVGTTHGVRVEGSNASATVTGAQGTAPGSYGAYARNGGSIIIEGDASGGAYGVYADDISSTVHVGGSVQGGLYGAYAFWSTIEIDGDAAATGTEGCGASSVRGTVTVHGNVSGNEYGGMAGGAEGKLTIDGGATATGVNGVGICANYGTAEVGGNVSAAQGTGALAASYGKITVDGVITADQYVKVENIIKNQTDFEAETTKAGYRTYKDSASIVDSTVWVKSQAAGNVCEIVGGTQYPTLGEALAAVQDGQTIRLLDDINYEGGICFSEKDVTFDLNGYILNVVNNSGPGLQVDWGNVDIQDTSAAGNGEFNVAGSNYGVAAPNHGSATVSNVTAAGVAGAYAGVSGTIVVIGDVKATVYGVAANDGSVTVGSDVEASLGAWADAEGEITINGGITTATYVKVGSYEKGIDDYITPTTKTGYRTYTDGESTVWVKAATGSNPPTWPNGSTLTASGTTKTRTTLSWTAAVDDVAVTGYRIYQDNLLIPTVTEAVYSQTVTGAVYSCEVTGLSSSTTYTFRVQAGDADNNWTYGPTVTVRTDSSGGGGGGRSSTPAPVPKPAAQVLDSNENVIESITPRLDSRTGTAVVEVNSASLTSAFDKSKANDRGIKTVKVNIPEIDGAKAYEPLLPVSFLTAGDTSKTVEIKTGIAAVTVPCNMLSMVDAATAKNVSLTIAAGDRSKLDAAVQAQIGDRPVIELNLKIDGKQTSWSNENAPVAVAIPYKPAAEELKDPEHITVWYIDGSGKAVSVPNGRYDPATGTVIFTATHFSSYAVVYVAKTFDDLGNAAWAKKQIEVLASKGILRGTTENKYSPQTDITRADFLYFLVRTLGIDARVDGNFDDIDKDTYYYKEIGIAKKLGIATGTGNNKFSPDASITRQDMMVLTERALRMLKKLKVQGTASDLEKFADKSLIAPYAIDSVASLVKEGLIVGSGGRVNPLGNTTRAEAAVFLYRIYNKY